jgi:asparagine synthase (glutamine-hydrolysing)
MSTLCGILGQRQPAVVQAMAQAMAHRGDARHVINGDAYSVAGSRQCQAPPCLLDGGARTGTALLADPAELAAYAQSQSRPQNLKLRGHFAAVLHHERTTQWWLLRDRAGVKPLYYYEGDGFLVFASELKGLLASGLVPRHLDLLSVDRYLTLRCVPGPQSIIKGVRRVQPGHVVRYGDGKVAEVPFHSYETEPHRIGRNEAADRLRALLEDALHDCDVDAMLWSAGLDSAAMAAVRRDIPPVYVGLEKGWRDESRKAEESAQSMGCALDTHAARKLTENTFSQVAFSLDEPVADAAVLPLWLIFQRAAQHGRHVMTGHGADELLGGYSRYRLLEKTRGAQHLVPSRLVTEILPALPPNAFIRRGSRYLARIGDNMEAYLSLLSVFDTEEREDLYTSAMKSSVHDQAAGSEIFRRHFQDKDFTRNVLSLDLNVILPDLLLVECDRLAAAHGVSLRFPYLDDKLVDFIVSVPPQVKYGVRSKSLLRHAMKGLVPGRIRLRPQRGFRIPQDGRLMRVIESAAAQIVTQDRVESAGIFRWQYVEQVMRSATHNVYRRRQFWALLMFFAWYREMMER